jgi:hypothetical protein
MSEPRAYGVDVEARPDGAILTPPATYVECLIKDLLDVLDRDDEARDLLADLLFGEPPARDPHMPDRPSRDDELAERLTRALPETSRQIRLHRPAALALRDRLSAALGWRGRRAAA